MRRRQLGIELHGALELGLGRRIVLPAEVRDADQQVRFRRLAGAEYAVHVLLPLGVVAAVQQRGAEQIRVGEVVAEHLLARLQQRDELLILAGLQVAVGQHQIRVLGLGRGRDDPFELRDRLIGPRGFVVGERQVQADRVVRRVGLQRRFVLRDRVVVLAQPDVGGAEIRRARRRGRG